VTIGLSTEYGQFGWLVNAEKNPTCNYLLLCNFKSFSGLKQSDSAEISVSNAFDTKSQTKRT